MARERRRLDKKEPAVTTLGDVGEIPPAQLKARKGSKPGSFWMLPI
jgi:hypothetical protein